MKVSIIIPIYNVAPYVKRCLSSVFEQSYKDIEVIIIDDCGSDNSMEIVAGTIKKYNYYNIKIIHHKYNKGLSAARNTGLSQASGEYVFFLDSDDVLPLNAIKDMANELVTYGQVDFVIGEIETFGIRRNSYPLLSASYLKSNVDIFNDYMQAKWNVMACNKLLNKNFLRENQLYFHEGIYHEDLDFSFKLAIKASSMVCCHHITYNYFIRKDSITTSKKLKNYTDNLDIIIDNISYLMHFETAKYNKQLISNYIINAFYTLLFDIARNENPNISMTEKRNIANSIKKELKNIQNYIGDCTIVYRIKKAILAQPFFINNLLFRFYAKLRHL